MHKIELPFGLKYDRLVHVSEVESGLACDCVCPKCHAKLIAKKGSKTTHHFSHYATTACQGSTETALHLAAKEIIDSRRYIILPEVVLEFSSHRPSIVLAETRKYTIDKVTIESGMNDIVPDLIVEIGGKPLLIEIYVTHRTESEKAAKIKAMGVSAIEIDLSAAPRNFKLNHLEPIVLDEISNKRWINNERRNFELNRFMAIAVRKLAVRRGLASHADDCPIAKRVWKGKSYANMIDDCLYCNYCVGVGTNVSFIDCVGHSNERFIVESVDAS